MKVLTFFDRKVKIPSPEEICNWDSGFEKELYEFCFDFIPYEGVYKPYLDVDRFVDKHREFYKFNLKERMSFYGLEIDKEEEDISEKCDNPDEFLAQKIIRFRLLLNHPYLVGIFSNISLKAIHSINNAKYILHLENIEPSDFKDILLFNKKIYDQTWNRTLSVSEDNAGNSSIGQMSESLFEESFKYLMDNTFFKVTDTQLKSYGDFVVMALPNNLWISVKSSNARERLLASGFNTDIIGIGFFKSAAEFSDLRIRNYQKVGFLALYLPDFPVNESQLEKNADTFSDYVEKRQKNNKGTYPTNINGKEFIRPTSRLFSDLKDLMQVTKLENRNTANF